MGVWGNVCGIVAGLAALWALRLLVHEQAVRASYEAKGMCQGIHWEWAHPHEYGDNLLTSVPQPRNLQTGQIEWVPLLG